VRAKKPKPDIRLLTYAEACEVLRIPRRALYRALDCGQLRRIVLGDEPRLLRSEVEGLIVSQSVGKRSPPAGRYQRAQRAMVAALREKNRKPGPPRLAEVRTVVRP